jgi:antitoxin component YwqK of YwqJK toxin-antitoxin module
MFIDGKEKSYYENGQLKRSCTYINGTIQMVNVKNMR